MSTAAITLESPLDGWGAASEDPIGLLALTLTVVSCGVHAQRRYPLLVEDIDLNEAGAGFSGYRVGDGHGWAGR